MYPHPRPKVSVIIPTYSHAGLIAETIDSVLAQSLADFEIIVIDDGSSDGTANVLADYIDRELISYHRQENGGVASARNAGLALAQGDYIAFLDDDDTWPADKLEWQVQCLEESPAVLVAGNMCQHGSAVGKSGCHHGSYVELTLAEFFRTNPFASPGQTLIRRTALKLVGGFDPSIWGADDLDLWIRLAQLGEIRKYDRLALFYRVHAANASLDLLRMARNAQQVMVKNLLTVAPEKRRKYTRIAYRFLFRAYGKKLIWKGAQLMKQGRGRDGLAVMRGSFAIFLPRIKHDPRLLISYLLAIIKIPYKMKSVR